MQLDAILPSYPPTFGDQGSNCNWAARKGWIRWLGV